MSEYQKQVKEKEKCAADMFKVLYRSLQLGYKVRTEKVFLELNAQKKF